MTCVQLSSPLAARRDMMRCLLELAGMTPRGTHTEACRMKIEQSAQGVFNINLKLEHMLLDCRFARPLLKLCGALRCKSPGCLKCRA